MRLPSVNKTYEYISMRGGLDLETPAISRNPGGLDLVRNYMADTDGGYSRIDGFERYSGKPSPSDAVYYYCEVTLTGTVSVGDTITGVTSGATGIVSISGTDYLDITKVSGTFVAENITVGGSGVGSLDVAPIQAGENTVYLDAVALNAAADTYRLDITKPAGTSGPVRGIGLLKGVLYCFLNNAAGTAGLIFKATGSGWTAISMYYELSFDTGVLLLNDGDSITQLVSGATATVKRVVWESGTWGSTATGRLILDNISGTFDNTHDIQVSGTTRVTSTSTASQISINPSGRYSIVPYNFYASTDTRRLYGADGKNYGFEFDGDIYVPIHTGMVTDTPLHVAAHKYQLFFSFDGSSQQSSAGYPYKWTAVTGASEIGVGDTITGYQQLPGKALAIFSRNSSNQLLGNNVTDFVLDPISDEVGSVPYTNQRIGHAYCLDDRGIVKISPTQAYGNFNQATISRKIQSVIDSMRSVVTASATYKTYNQYRLYGSDGTGVCMTILNNGRVAFTQFKYPVNVACTCTGEDANGKDVVFFGDDAGMVYQADKGSSFDGEEIEAYIGLPYNNSKSPAVIKSYRKLTIEMTSTGYASLKYSPSFTSGDIAVAEHIATTITEEGSGGLWDVAYWDTFFWDGVSTSKPSINISGNGTNMALTIYSKSDIDLGHKIDGIIVHYINRRLVR